MILAVDGKDKILFKL